MLASTYGETDNFGVCPMEDTAANAQAVVERSGAWVVSVAPSSAAVKAGIKSMDVILHLSGQLASTPDDVQRPPTRL